MMASESCSTSSSSSGDDFVPIFFASQSYEVIPQNVRQEPEYNTVDETDAAAAAPEARWKRKRSRLGLVSAGFSSGEDILVPVWRVRRAGIEDRHAPVVLIVSSVWRKFSQRRRTARRSTAVAVDLPVFSIILIQLRALGRRWQAFWTWPSAL